MKRFQLIVGSQMGAAEYVADELADSLRNLGHEAVVHEQPDHQIIPVKDTYWLICTSTHGAGECPDNIKPFVAALREHSPSLSNIEYGIIGLGDTSYDTFCQASHEIDQLLTTLGAQKSGQLLEINVLDERLPEEYALDWLPIWLKSL